MMMPTTSFRGPGARVRRLGSRRPQRGFSLVELMVALLVGLVVVGALLSTLLATSVSSRHGQALTQMSQDASTALGILREQMVQVGYGRPTGVNGAGKFVKAYPGGVAGFTGGAGLVGCDAAFVDASLATIDALTCSGAGGPAIAVAYEADASGSVVSAAGVPLDCLGNGVPQQNIGLPGAYYLAFNKFYLDTPKGAAHKALYCYGIGSPAAQALVENVENMQIMYGVTTNPGAAPVQVNYYVPAATLNGGGAPLTKNYSNVVSVRLCVLVGSTEAVVDKDPTSGKWPQYRDCDGTLKDPADGRMYRAFTSTVVLQNMLPM